MTIFSPPWRHDTRHVSRHVSRIPPGARAHPPRAHACRYQPRARRDTSRPPRLRERIVQDANAAFSIPGSVVFEEGKGGLPVCKLTHKNGGTAEVYIFGACVTSW
jgi:glucose-6-phosphate 1-epimerase